MVDKFRLLSKKEEYELIKKDDQDYSKVKKYLNAFLDDVLPKYVKSTKDRTKIKGKLLDSVPWSIENYKKEIRIKSGINT